MSYIDLPTLKAGINITVDSDDSILLKCIAAAQKAIETKCQRVFEANADTTRYFDYINDVDERVLRFDKDLCAITTILNGDGTTVAPTAYVTNPRNSTPWCEISLKMNSDIAWTYDDTPEDAIAVTGKWAFSETAPEDIQLACERLATWFYRQRDTSNDGSDRPILTNSGAVIMPSKLPSDVIDLITPYIRRFP